jgi:hypothetical protein
MAGGFAEGPAAKLTLHQIALVLGMLCTGCINNLVKKYAYDTSSTGAKFENVSRAWAGRRFRVAVCAQACTVSRTSSQK